MSSIFEVEQGRESINPQDFEPLAIAKNERSTTVRPAVYAIHNSEDWSLRSFRAVDEPVRVEALVTEPTVVTKKFLDGTQTTENVAADKDCKVGDPFAPVLLREGAGANSRLVRHRLVSLDWRGGLGFRQNRYNGSFVQESSSPGQLIFSEQDPSTSRLERQSSATSG